MLYEGGGSSSKIRAASTVLWDGGRRRTRREAQATHGAYDRVMSQTEHTPQGWVKPVAAPTRESLQARIDQLRAELEEAEAQLREMNEGARLEALVKVRNLMRAFELTPADLGLTPAPKHRGRPRKAA